MDDYISRQAAIDIVSRNLERMNNVTSGAMYGPAELWLKEVPAADVVEVVRCKDCKWYNKSGCAIYIADDTDKPTENDFCSFGERADK